MLQELVKQAASLVRRNCHGIADHDWLAVGGRACPLNEQCTCSQLVFECQACGAIDYGSHREGPGHIHCKENCETYPLNI